MELPIKGWAGTPALDLRKKNVLPQISQTDLSTLDHDWILIIPRLQEQNLLTSYMDKGRGATQMLLPSHICQSDSHPISHRVRVSS